MSTETKDQTACLQAEPQAEHRWLEQLVGEWTYEAETMMEPGIPFAKCSGSESVRSLGGLWIVAEGNGEMPGGDPATMILTLGYDPQKQRFVGTWIGSMMTHLWVYDGVLAKDGSSLTLDSEGPGMAGTSTMSRFRDVIALTGSDSRTLTSQLENEDGSWQTVMTVSYKRTG